MNGPPLYFQYDGGAMRPLRPKAADRYYAVGGIYCLEERQERSHASHSHYFASIHEIWANLPDHLAARFPGEEHLRKFALIRTGFRDERSIACGSKAEARRMAAFIKPLDDFAVVVAREALIIVYTAKSQSMKAMGKEQFQKSKTAVLDYLAGLIGTSAAEVSKQASAA